MSMGQIYVIKVSSIDKYTLKNLFKLTIFKIKIKIFMFLQKHCDKNEIDGVI